MKLNNVELLGNRKEGFFINIEEEMFNAPNNVQDMAITAEELKDLYDLLKKHYERNTKTNH